MQCGLPRRRPDPANAERIADLAVKEGLTQASTNVNAADRGHAR